MCVRDSYLHVLEGLACLEERSLAKRFVNSHLVHSGIVTLLLQTLDRFEALQFMDACLLCLVQLLMPFVA